MARIEDILNKHGLAGPCLPLAATGVANHIYATQDFVIRIATDHEDSLPDARTEVVAAPVVHAFGIKSPRLIAFDLTARPYSIWERIHGETLGLIHLSETQATRLWHQVGQQLALLHSRVTSCPDPENDLDTPGFEPDLDEALKHWADTQQPAASQLAAIEQLIVELVPSLQVEPPHCFLHNDLHPNNIMCTHTGDLLALIDWGDAGWGDPALDFASIPFQHLEAALAGYSRPTPSRARILWAQLQTLLEQPNSSIPVHQFHRFLAG